MIIDISEAIFKQIFNDKSLFLPIRWGGNDFSKEVRFLFSKYKDAILQNLSSTSNDDLIKKINSVCKMLENAVNSYLDGFPNKAYGSFTRAMKVLNETPLKVYEKSVLDLFDNNQFLNDELNLYRVACVDENKIYPRKRLFHTPYNMRSKVPTCRYSIAGYPCLYLGTDLQLCCEEVHFNHHEKNGLAARFAINRSILDSETVIQVIELSIKPQDYFEESQNKNIILPHKNSQLFASYLVWYPLIAACSYIRVNKKDPFAPEYILPQLLMQWVRSELGTWNKNDTLFSCNKLIGIRYFSCASEKASNMGVNYVFPGSGHPHSDEYPFCETLMNSFFLTKPYYINEYVDVKSCERIMNHDTDLKKINE